MARLAWAERVEQVTGIRPQIDARDEISIAALLAKGERKPG